MFHKPDTRIHFVGIGGIGMSGIAEVLLNLGYGVSGTDLQGVATPRAASPSSARAIQYGHDAAHLGAADVVVISSAVKPTTRRSWPRARAASRSSRAPRCSPS